MLFEFGEVYDRMVTFYIGRHPFFLLAKEVPPDNCKTSPPYYEFLMHDEPIKVSDQVSVFNTCDFFSTESIEEQMRGLGIMMGLEQYLEALYGLKIQTIEPDLSFSGKSVYILEPATTKLDPRLEHILSQTSRQGTPSLILFPDKQHGPV